LLPQDLLHFPLVGIGHVDQGDRVAGLLADDRDDRPGAGPARDGEDLQVGDLERAALLVGPVVDHRQLGRVRKADDQELMAVG
jgi:hypothetical protein